MEPAQRVTGDAAETQARGPAAAPSGTDLLGRPLRDLRVSVTDRCNFRCTYCMPREVFGVGHQFTPREQLLTFEEITRLVGVFAGLGVTKVRLTGGEPLLRRDLPTLVAQLRGVAGIGTLALTTNGSLLAGQAERLRAAGLDRVTVSLDSLDPQVFAAMADTVVPLSTVLDGIAAARDAGLGPVKLNTVVRRGVNDAGVEDLVTFAREGGHIVRFIEYMDVGTSNGWQLTEVVPSAELVARVHRRWPLEPVPGEPAAGPARGQASPGVARRYRFLDGGGEIGVISSVTEPFCATCTRARLTATGELFTCLFATAGTDLRALLRGGADDAALAGAIGGIWQARADRYSQLRTSHTGAAPGARRAEMSYLGG